MDIIKLKSDGYKSITQICRELHKDKDVYIPEEILKNGIKHGKGTYYPPETVINIINYLKLSKTEKYKMTCQRRYGVDNVSQLKEIQNKKSKTMLEHYGTDKSFNLPQTKSSIKSKYGVENISQNEEIKLKKKETIFNNYGVSSSFVLPTFKQSIKSKYGVENISQNEEIKKLKRKGLGKKYYFDNTSFDSTWELALYFYLKFNKINFIYQPLDKKFTYFANGKYHTYFPDFKIENKYYEIKGDQFFDENDNFRNPYSKNKEDQILAEAKFDCMKKNNIIILREKDMKIYIDFAESKLGNLYNFKKEK